MLSFITSVWASTLFGIIYLVVGVLVGVNLLKYLDPAAWVILLHTDKKEKWAYYMDSDGESKSVWVTTWDKLANLVKLLIMITCWPVIIIIVIVILTLCKIFKYILDILLPYYMPKVPIFTIKLEKEKK